MPEIRAFRGIRYNLGRVGSLSDVVAPPYDVIDPQMQDELYRKHPYNIVRVDLNRIEPGKDDEADNRYTRSARLLRQWQAEGILMTEADPAIYVYHQQFQYDGRTYLRRGFLARMRISPFGEGLVFPHEETFSAPKFDRLMLTVVCKANLSPVFGLYPDPTGQVQQILEQAIAGATPLEATDHLGVVHRMWPVVDVSVEAALNAAIGPKPVFIADGHHRYETACEYRRDVYESGFLSKDHPANYVLMMLIAMEDPGLIVLPTHRLFTGLPGLDTHQLAEKLGPLFALQSGGTGYERAREVWEEMEIQSDQEMIAFYTAADQQWTVARITDAGRQRMAELAPDRSPQWRSLGVAVLHRLVVDELLQCAQLPPPEYVHTTEDLIAQLQQGKYHLAAMVNPATTDHVRQISFGGERLPPKSTYFYPKLLTGLVINPLE
jgi:uncharacterized protein (DUF1015 family)